METFFFAWVKKLSDFSDEKSDMLVFFIPKAEKKCPEFQTGHGGVEVISGCGLINVVYEIGYTLWMMTPEIW